MSQSSVSSIRRVVDTRFGRIWVWERGAHDDKAPLVFLQGFLAGPDAWTDTINTLATNRRCITVDWPFGAHRQPLNDDADTSPPAVARLVVDVLDGLGIERAILIGNDSGGVIAQLVVASDPQRVAGLVLVSCDAFEVFPPGVYRYLFRLAVLPGVVTALARSMTVPAFAKSRFGYGAVISRRPERALPWVKPLASEAAIRRDLRRLMVGSSNRQTISAAKEFANYNRPVLVVWGEHDRLFPRGLGERLAQAFPRGRFEVVPDCATFVPVDQPHRLAALLDEFLMELAA
jgi:pimeloyl-ACP methyl ester carboxylesterase